MDDVNIHDNKGIISIALMISTLIIIVCCAISISLTSKVVSSDSVLNQVRNECIALNMLDDAVVNYKTGKLKSDRYFDNNWEEVEGTSKSVRYKLEYNEVQLNQHITLNIKILDIDTSNTVGEVNTHYMIGEVYEQ